MRRIPKWLPSLHEPGPPRLWRIGYALAASFVVALAGLAALGAVTLVLLHHPALPRSHEISVHDTVGVAQLVFASVAGAGALVALVVAYRRQRVSEASSANDRTRVFNERFTAIAAQLGEDKPAVRLAGVHAMAGLADDWAENQQTCIDVLCAYLRLPHDADPGDDTVPGKRTAYLADQEVRHTVIRLISAHLREGAASWHGFNVDFTGTVFDGGDFSGAVFSGGRVSFEHAKCTGGQVDFTGAEFTGDGISFSGAEFTGGQVSFVGAVFSGHGVDFEHAMFTGGQVDFTGARFTGGSVTFNGADFSKGKVIFQSALFRGGQVTFTSAMFTGGQVDFGAEFSGSYVVFNGADFSRGKVIFRGAHFSSGQVSFRFAHFSRGEVSVGAVIDFGGAWFSGGRVHFAEAVFSGGQVSFGGAEFTGGEVDFRDPREWTEPPEFDWTDTGTPPPGVMLRDSADAAPTPEPGSAAPRQP